MLYRARALLANALFVILLATTASLIAWLSQYYRYQGDWTAGARHSLSQDSQALLARLRGPLRIVAFARYKKDRDQIVRFLDRYRAYKPNVELEFVDLLAVPEKVREYDIEVHGELVLDYRGRRQHVRPRPGSASVSGGYREDDFAVALQRLLLTPGRRLAFLEGHGERRPQGIANHDLKRWGVLLNERGYKAEPLSIGDDALPKDIGVLVIAGPRVALLASERAAIEQYLEDGGNLLWLADPGPQYGLERIADYLGVEIPSGIVLGPSVSELQGLDDPSLAVVKPDGYGQHPALADFDLLTLFPEVAAVRLVSGEDWRSWELAGLGERAWLETSELVGHVQYDAGEDWAGPLSIAVALERDRGQGRKQRVAIVGDGDFLSNTYIGNGGNAEFGLRLVDWLSGEDDLMRIGRVEPDDAKLKLPPRAAVVLSAAFCLVLPALFLAAGEWQRRRRR